MYVVRINYSSKEKRKFENVSRKKGYTYKNFKIENIRNTFCMLSVCRIYERPLFLCFRCKCPDETYKCVRTGENVSISAYVYHCRQNTTVDDIEGETDMDYLS